MPAWSPALDPVHTLCFRVDVFRVYLQAEAASELLFDTLINAESRTPLSTGRGGIGVPRLSRHTAAAAAGRVCGDAAGSGPRAAGAAAAAAREGLGGGARRLLAAAGCVQVGDRSCLMCAIGCLQLLAVFRWVLAAAGCVQVDGWDPRQSGKGGVLLVKLFP